MLFKILKKTVETLGFKLVEKNLIKNDRLISQYSFLKLESILEKLFFDKKINFIIQIGANDGKRFDIINKFVKKYSPKAIFLEPIKSNFNDLKNNYSEQKNLFFENLAISVNNQIEYLYKVSEDKIHLYDDHIVGLTSFTKKHLIKHGVKEKHIRKELVNTISINELLKKYDVDQFDLLFIDTEGYDGEIVSDFITKSKLRPIIIFEYIHINNNVLKSTLKSLSENKYIFFKIEENIISYPNEKKDIIQLS